MSNTFFTQDNGTSWRMRYSNYCSSTNIVYMTPFTIVISKHFERISLRTRKLTLVVCKEKNFVLIRYIRWPFNKIKVFP